MATIALELTKAVSNIDGIGGLRPLLVLRKKYGTTLRGCSKRERKEHHQCQAFPHFATWRRGGVTLQVAIQLVENQFLETILQLQSQSRPQGHNHSCQR